MSSKNKSKGSKHSKNKKTKIRIKNPYILTIITIIIFILTLIGIISKGKNNTVNTGMEISKSNQEYVDNETTNEWKIENENIIDENLILPNETSDNNETENEEIESNELPNPNENKINYYIKVNIRANVVNIYKTDIDGNYTVPYKAMICSTGKATPAAGKIYTMPNDKWNRSTWGAMVGGVYAQYYSRINGSILFHSVPYTKQKKSSLEYWEYDKLGTKASAGCIRLTVEDAKWIYNNCPPGTKVEFYASSDPGPFGKPTARKISNESSAVRGWDPTDPDSSNPWNNYNTNTEKNVVKNTDSNKNTTSKNITTNNSISDSTINDTTNITTNTTNNNTVNEATENVTVENKIENNNTTNTTESNETITYSNQTENTTTNDENEEQNGI